MFKKRIKKKRFCDFFKINYWWIVCHVMHWGQPTNWNLKLIWYGKQLPKRAPLLVGTKLYFFQQIEACLIVMWMGSLLFIHLKVSVCYSWVGCSCLESLWLKGWQYKLFVLWLTYYLLCQAFAYFRLFSLAALQYAKSIWDFHSM